MTSSLRDIPGAATPRRGHNRGGRAVGAVRPYRAPALFDPSAGLRAPARRKRLFEARHRKPDLFLFVLLVGTLGLLGYIWNAAHDANQVSAGIEGVDDGALLTAEEAGGLDVVFSVDEEAHLEVARVTLDGEPVEDLERLDQGFRWRADPEAPLPDGEHTFVLTVDRALNGTSVHRAAITVDGTPPLLAVPKALPPAPIDAAVTVAGRVEPDATLTLDGRDVATDEGSFAVTFDHPPAAPLHLRATDPAGNVSEAQVVTPVDQPGCRGVHASAAAWGHDELRAGVMQLVDEGRIDCVELTIKDEGGDVGHVTGVALANDIGAARDLYDLEEVIDELHAKGVRVVGRLVAFRDPILASAAWERGDEDWVMQTPDGQPLANYGGFTNFVHEDVRQYNIDLAIEAADAGIDEILWDYIRRPEGALDSMVVPGLEGDIEAAIVDFLSETYPMLRAKGVLQGVSVFGIAATRPEAVGQDVVAMAHQSDVIAPMVYPSLWTSGEYGVDDPKSMPYEIVKGSVEDFQLAVRGTGAKVRPWLQHFNLGHTYGPAEIDAQIRASNDLGIQDWLFWSAAVRYDPESFVPLTPPG